MGSLPLDTLSGSAECGRESWHYCDLTTSVAKVAALCLSHRQTLSHYPLLTVATTKLLGSISVCPGLFSLTYLFARVQIESQLHIRRNTFYST